MIHLIRISYFALIGYFLLCNLSIYQKDWWNMEVDFSDWRGIGKVDYSTNMIVDWWYNGKGSKYYRYESMKEINERLDRGDTLTIGIDYYGLFPISSQFIPIPLLERYGIDLMNGKVIKCKLYASGGEVIFAY